MSNVLPTDDEVLALVPGRDSITWRRASDARGFVGSGYALMLQVAHPTVGAGVLEHSNYKADPWGRLFRTLDFLNSLIYADPHAAAAVARNIRSMHTRIKGTKADGTKYHALEPAAYAWVHATLFEAILRSHKHFGNPFDRAQSEQFWVEWRRLGRLLGVREGDLPPTFGGFYDYFDAMVEDTLENNRAVQDVLETMGQPATPPWPSYAMPAWRLMRGPSAHSLELATVGLLPPVLRERLGLEWTRTNQVEFRTMGAASRALTPVLPRSLRVLGPSYLRWRREETARLATTAPPAPRAIESAA
jgi:uncharacterized protein (DUF2236 family)